VAGGGALRGDAAGREGADDVDPPVPRLRSIVPLRLPSGVRTSIAVPEVARLACHPLAIRGHARDHTGNLLPRLLLVRLEDDAMDVCALLQGEELLAYTLHQNEDDVLDTDRSVRDGVPGAAGSSDYREWPWRSGFFQAVTESYDRQHVFNEKMGFDDRVTSARIKQDNRE
jgi:hypothetical protein